jgi:hypothetical protein
MKIATTLGVLVLFAALPLFACIGVPGIDNAGSLIQSELNAGRNAVLCTNTTWSLTSTIVFPAGQNYISIYTVGLPRDGSRAFLRLDSDATACAIRADGQNDVQLRNVIVDGGFGRLPTHHMDEGLIRFGGAGSGQIVDSVYAYGSRGWSTILFEMGPWPHCNYGSITNNQLGRGGTPDGYYADGISLQCANTDVLYNLIEDMTDGGIVIFGAPGSTIRYNDIRANTVKAVSGIAMVDMFGTNNGDFTGTQVFGNSITANAFMAYGIAMGRKFFYGLTGWCETADLYVYGGNVHDNTLYGPRMGYGYAIDGVIDWTFRNNADYSTHVGRGVRDCGDCDLPPVGGYIKHTGFHVAGSSVIEGPFVDGCFHGGSIQYP